MPTTISILGAGWLGLPLGEFLAGTGHHVYGSTTRAAKTTTMEALGIHPLVFDIATRKPDPDAPFWKSEILIITIPPSAMAKGARKSTHSPDPVYRDRLETMIDLGRAHGLQRVIYTSSTSVYGKMKGEINEEMGAAPYTTSAQMVAQVEEMVLEKMGKGGTILRLGGLVGGQREPTRYLAGKTDLKNGGQPVNLIHRNDVVKVISHMVKTNPPNRIYNLVADQHPSRAEYHQARATLLGLPQPEFSPEPFSTAGKRILNHRLKQDLAYTFLHPDPIHFP